jgi:CubicO group peptidase (beta-lactamase class C family)
MRHGLIVRITTLVAVLALAVPAAAMAGTPPSTVYHGVWDSATVCGEQFTDSGVWNVNMKNDGTAMVSVRIFKDGRPHAAWGGNYFHADFVAMAVGTPPTVFHVVAVDPFGAGVDLVFDLASDGRLTYALTNYCDDGSAALLYGHATH